MAVNLTEEWMLMRAIAAGATPAADPDWLDPTNPVPTEAIAFPPVFRNGDVPVKKIDLLGVPFDGRGLPIQGAALRALTLGWTVEVLERVNVSDDPKTPNPIWLLGNDEATQTIGRPSAIGVSEGVLSGGGLELALRVSAWQNPDANVATVRMFARICP